MIRLQNFGVLGVLCFALLPNCMAQEASPAAAGAAVPTQYAATAIGEAGAAAGRSFGMNIYLDGITNDGQVEELLGILKQKGQDGVVDAMENMKDVGRIAPTGSTGTGLRVVRIRPGKNGGLHIVLVTNRPISFGELYNGTRSRDYPFSFVVLDVDKDGKGSGKFAPLCKVKINKNKQVEIENYGQKPFRLANVYRQK